MENDWPIWFLVNQWARFFTEKLMSKRTKFLLNSNPWPLLNTSRAIEGKIDHDTNQLANLENPNDF